MSISTTGAFLTHEVVARDGARLATDVHLPPGAGGPVPVVLERSHYGRRNDRLRSFAAEVTARGWAYVVQDVRGRGDSDGTFHLLMNYDEGPDGLATVNWIREQPWASGEIVTIGFSGSTATQQALAVTDPPGLRAQALLDGGVNYYLKVFRQHGIFNEGMVLSWVATQAVEGSAAQADDDVRSRLRSFVASSATWADQLPLERGSSPLAADPEYEALYLKMRDQADDSSFWDTPTARLQGRYWAYPRIPVFLASGWFAHHNAATFEKYERFTARGQSVRMVIGPWIHNLPSMGTETRTGTVDFGDAALRREPVLLEALDWIVDRSTESAEEMPGSTIDYFRMGGGAGRVDASGNVEHGGSWFTTTAWPPSGSAPRTYHLQPAGLELDPAGSVAVTEFVHDPEHPRRSRGGLNISNRDYPGFIQPGPRDQGPAGSDPAIASFLTAPLTDDLDVTGPVRVVLWVSSSLDDADFFVKVSDVYPPDGDADGFAVLVSEGCSRLSYRNGRTTASAATPDEWVELTVDLTPVSNLFAAGHSIRVDVAGADFPNYEVHPSRRRTTQRIAHGGDRPSRLELTVIESPPSR